MNKEYGLEMTALCFCSKGMNLNNEGNFIASKVLSELSWSHLNSKGAHCLSIFGGWGESSDLRR